MADRDVRGGAGARAADRPGAARAPSVPGPAGGDRVRQRHRARPARAGRDVHGRPLRSRLARLFAAVARPRRAAPHLRAHGAGAGVRGGRRRLRARPRERAAARRRARRVFAGRDAAGDALRGARSRRRRPRPWTTRTRAWARTRSRRSSSPRGPPAGPRAWSTRSGCSARTRRCSAPSSASSAEEPPVLCDWSPWNHTAGGNHNFGLVLYNGGTLYVDEGGPMPGRFDATVRNLREVACTAHFAVPRTYEMLMPHLRRDPVLRETFFRRLQAPLLCRRRSGPALLGPAPRLGARGVRRGDPDHDRLRLHGDGAVRDEHRAAPARSPGCSACPRRASS